MKVIDPGHVYELQHLDEQHSATMSQTTRLAFVKRVGDKFPGNEPPAHAGITIQEATRAILHRLAYVNAQEQSDYTTAAIHYYRQAMWALEMRAAERAGEPHRLYQPDPLPGPIEEQPVCRTCGHVRCGGAHP